MSSFASLTAHVLRVVAAETGITELTPETRFDDLNLDSLEFVDLVHAIQDATERTLPDSAFATAETIADLAAALL